MSTTCFTERTQILPVILSKQNIYDSFFPEPSRHGPEIR
jgi:hypothetical protein